MPATPIDIARNLVLARFPRARAAWLGGSVALGTPTATSDLDITVLLAGPPAPYRESLRHESWPVELFVQSGESVTHFRVAERAARRPATARLIGQSHILLDADGSGERLRQECARELSEGPQRLSEKELRARRYGVTDLLDDLAGAQDANERLVVGAALWQATADLLLTANRHWIGGGKWLHRELAAFDQAGGTDFGRTLADGMRAVALGDVDPMTAVVLEVLSQVGGRLFEGFRADGPA
ncbi:nucleotidyltransferase domain-containing protein [Nocardia sp. CA2R105]|uniref:nucleotidyltransferase domain-containing protein n=1 Tax=Nocardia coffeae TaxID=2873381 RepID=UPI001CA5FDB0|nr:nucleotidyltransferase domain-containing protein [Nocardia coffeae]MBY8859362.1 nucleotidyltransferase domain-containing protein [Nocardia coffeae]